MAKLWDLQVGSRSIRTVQTPAGAFLGLEEWFLGLQEDAVTGARVLGPAKRCWDRHEAAGAGRITFGDAIKGCIK